MLKLLLLLLTLSMGSAFVIAPLASSIIVQQHAQQLLLLPSSSSSFHMAVSTVDPTTFLSDVLGSFINSPAILAIPIGAALLIAFLIAYLIQAYASPQVEDDE
jgi:hypothetical protein